MTVRQTCGFSIIMMSITSSKLQFSSITLSKADSESLKQCREGSAEPVGGIARFQAVANYYRNNPAYAGQPKLITLFSGDAFSPSLESSVTKGGHMVSILNNIGTDAACVGVSMACSFAHCMLIWP